MTVRVNSDYFPEHYYGLVFLGGAFANLRQATFSFVVTVRLSVCLSVCLSVRMELLGSPSTDFHEILYLSKGKSVPLQARGAQIM